MARIEMGFQLFLPGGSNCRHFYSRQPKRYHQFANQPNPDFLSAELLERFLNSVSPLGGKLGPVMFQFEYLNRDKMASRKKFLDQLHAFFEAAPKGQARVGVQLRIDENGILEVLARDTTTGKDTVVTIDSAAVDVDDEAVEEMVSQSVEHAFDDMAERVFTEARLKAEELLPAVEVALAQGMAEEGERAEIEGATAEVRAAIAGRAANPLKAAVERLDKATEVMAARLVEQAMERALERKMGERFGSWTD